MRIGISVITHANQNIWENGMGQNVFFLARALKAIPFVRSVVLINVGDQNRMADQIDLGRESLTLLNQEQASDQVDVIIELAGALHHQWLALQRARGKKVVYYCVGQPYAGLIEGTIFERPGFFPMVGRCDEIWLLPEYIQHASMMRVLNRCPVRQTPYLWSSSFLEKRVQEVSEKGYRYGWDSTQKGPRALRAAIFEPNVSVVKTSSISMLVCDEAYRADREALQMMHVLNTLHMKDHPTMLHFANSLDLVKDHKACFHGRHDVVGFMAQHADAVVSHQWDNEQNYSYMDALYGDYPLVHNSAWLHSFGAGYFYPGFEAAEGGKKLQWASAHHDECLPDQRAATQKLFAALDPVCESNVRTHIQMLKDLCSDAPHLMEAA